MSVDTSGATEEYDDLQFGDTLEYVGPADFGGEWVAPDDLHGPYEFKHVSVGGMLTLGTRFKGRRRLAPEHPANDRSNWRVVE